MLLEKLQLITSALILLTSFIMLTQNRINNLIATFAWQSIFLAVATLLQAMVIKQNELYFSVLLILVLKVFFIPYLMRYLVIKLNIRHTIADIKRPFLLLIGSAVLVLFCFHLIEPIRATSWLAQTNVIAVAIAITLLGMLLLITRRKAISHVIGFMAMENGIFFAALVATHGMPLTVELGIAFDVLVAVVLFGVFFFHIRQSIESLDVDRLNLLREDD